MRRAGLVLLLTACAAGRGAGPAPVEADPRAPGVAGEAPARPNVVLVLVDDLGTEVFGCYGAERSLTPTCDALAEAGLRFTRAHAQPLCTPSRVKLLTGRSNLRNYVHFGILDPAERTFAHLLGEAGYATCAVGKWQLFGTRIPTYGAWAGLGTRPEQAGFDTWCLWQVEELGSRYWGPKLERDGELVREPEDAYGPDLYLEHLLAFVSEPREAPFLAYFPMALVHDPFVRTPLSPPGERGKQEAFEDMVRTFDGMMGRFLAGLEAAGVADDTLLLITSDNGTGRGVRTPLGPGLEDAPGGKGASTDRGTHVPLLAVWPGRVAPGDVCEDPVDLSDFLPTLAELAGAELPADRVLDGVSFAPRLVGRPWTPRRSVTIWSDPRPGRTTPVRFARGRRYKLYGDGRLFDLDLDPLERTPLLEAGQDPAGLPPEAAAAHRDLAEDLGRLPAAPERIPWAHAPTSDG